VKSHKGVRSGFTSLILILPLLAGFAEARSLSKYACSEANPEQLCNAANTCASASSPCTVDVKRTSDGASTTSSIPNAKSNGTFCVKEGTTVTWKSTSKDVGFLIDIGPASPFAPSGAISGGSDRSVSVVAKKPGAISIPREPAGLGKSMACVEPELLKLSSPEQIREPSTVRTYPWP